MDVKGFNKMITDIQQQHELLKIALLATDNYLKVEKDAVSAGAATNAMIHDFSYHMSTAHDALQALGVLDQHEEYMQNHVETMLKLHGHKDKTIADLPYAHVPTSDYGEVEESNVWDNPSPVKNSKALTPDQKSKAKARAKAAGRTYPNMVDNIWAARQESKLVNFSDFLNEEAIDIQLNEQDLDRIVETWTWYDQVFLYNDDELEYDEEALDEALSPQARIKKRQSFARSRGKRNVARNIKLKRASSIQVLQKRAKLAARRVLYKRLLRGRDKSSLSAAEKSRVEQQVSRMKYLQTTLATRLLPKMRKIEQNRIASAVKSSPTSSYKFAKAPKVNKK